MPHVRPAAVAGAFYPGQGAALSSAVQTLLAAVSLDADAQQVAPKALIVPHAGYIYSGSTAALAYAQLKPWRNTLRRVVLLGPVHRVPVRGLALPGATAFATPLGEVPIDTAAVAALADLPQVVVSPAAHAQEHSLEVQLPFLQCVLDDFTLVPMAVGDATPAEVAQVLERLWGGPETLIVISSDLSHFLPYRTAQGVDHATVEAILALAGPVTHEQACGGTPVNGLLLAARRHGLQPRLLGLCNSGDTAGDKERVVGYAALSFSQTPVPAREHGRVLLQIARSAIARALGLGSPPLPEEAAAPWVQTPGATFVTLTQQGRLRGCIGSLEAHRALQQDVEGNAVAAARHDPRFAPLRAEELERTRIEVSLLSAREALTFGSEAEALAQLRPGVDGVVLTCGHLRSTFLPQVWEQLPDVGSFMAHLKQKAGLPADFWSAQVRLERYTVTPWKETDFPAPPDGAPVQEAA